MDKDIRFSLTSLTALKIGSPGSTIENRKNELCWNKNVGNNVILWLKDICVFYIPVEAAYHDHDYQIVCHIHNNRFQW